MFAGMAATAHAVFLHPGGLGQALVYPYYTVNGDNITLLTLLNSSADAKAVKLRFLEGYNGRDVLDVNVYLQPYDMWTGAVIPAGDGAALFTNDTSCTVPKLPSTATAALPFSTKNFTHGSAQGEDGGPTDFSRTREGHVEVIEMGTVTNETRQTRDSLKRTGDDTDCAQVRQAWADGGYWLGNAQTDIGPATGGLAGVGAILNVPLGTFEAYNADALAQFYAKGGAGEHSAAEALTPNLASATSLTAQIYANDEPLSLTFASGVEAVSAVFMAETIANEYWTAGGTAASSEWVITYPTKRFYVDPYYVGSEAKLPFENTYRIVTGNIATAYTELSLLLADREGKAWTPSVCFFAGACLPPRLLYESQVVTLGQGGANGGDQWYGARRPSSILASNMVPMNFPASSVGWAKLDFHQGRRGANPPLRTLTAKDGRALVGQPVSGFWVTQLINGNVDGKGVLSNYTALFRHKTATRCINTTDGSPCS